MLVPRPEDVIHKGWLLRLLTAICDEPVLSLSLGFKGGTCAAMRGLIDRFSVDLDFDVMGDEPDMPGIKKAFQTIFDNLGLRIADRSVHVPQYFLKYPAAGASRNSIKIDVLSPPPRANRYEAVSLIEIDRVVKCQTMDTLVANKMVAILDRHDRSKTIAGRDLFDLHSFLLKGLSWRSEIILERRGTSEPQFLQELIAFIEKQVTQTTIDQDINLYLAPDVFRTIRKTLKTELLSFLRDALKRAAH